MHGLTQASEKTVDMTAGLENGDVGMAVFCSAELSEKCVLRGFMDNANLGPFREQRSQSWCAKQFPVRS